MNKRRVFFIGIDGGDWQILKPLMKKGLMPNLKKLFRKNSQGILNSTLPPLTAPAWSSFLTGVNPGKHGIFFWQSYWKLDQGRELLTNNDIKVDQLPTMLNQNELKTGLVNFPMTYPVNNVNGFMIGGMLSPKIDQRSVYPEKDIQYIKNQGYRINIKKNPNKIEYFEQLAKMVSVRTKVLLKLTNKHQTNFSGIVYTAGDRVQHAFLKQIMLDLNNKLIRPRKKKILKKAYQVYRAIDQGIGQIINQLSDDDLLIIASDHGFQINNKYLNLNKALLDNNMLKPTLKTSLAYYAVGFLRRFSWAKKFKDWLRFALIPHAKKKKINKDHFKNDLAHASGVVEGFDQRKTKAFSGLSSEQGIYLTPSVSTSQKKETVNKIIKILSQLTDPETGKKVVSKIDSRDKIYSGPKSDKAPEIVFAPAPGYKPITPMLFRYPLVEPAPQIDDGDHRQEGIMLFWQKGNQIELNKKEAQIWDVLPTILDYYQIEKPTDLDGQSLVNFK